MAARATLAATTTAVAEVLVRGLTHIEDLAAEAEMHTGQVVVEVHLHMLVADFTNHCGHRTLLRLHDELGTHLHHVVQHTVLHKDFLVQVQHVAVIAHTIALLRSQVEAIVVAGFFAYQVFLKLGKHLMHSADKGKRLFLSGLLDDTAVLVFLAQDISHCHDGLILNFHIFKNLEVRRKK